MIHRSRTRRAAAAASIAAAGVLAACASPDADLVGPRDDELHVAAGAPVRTPASTPAVPEPADAPPAWGSDEARGDVLAAVEILGFQFLLNRYDRAFAEDGYAYDVDAHSLRRNLDGRLEVDRDPFGVNQLGHPFSGSLYHGFARSTGHDFWTSTAYTFAGSLVWEVAGETTPPSINDQVHTGIGGAFLGEALFRTASWLLESGGGSPGALRELGAFALSPPTGFNRLAFGDRFRGVFPGRGAAVAARLGAGVDLDVERGQTGGTDPLGDPDAAMQLAIEYGLPGEAGYRWERPFDWFQLQIAATGEEDNLFERVVARGLLVGAEYGSTAGTCGVHGLFGSYDYRSPGLFRVASTALSYGTVVRSPLWEGASVRCTALGGVGFGAAGTVDDDFEDRDYHHGAVPQAALELLLQQSERVALQLGVRDYHVIGVASEDGYGHENVLQADVALTLRIAGSHALRVEYQTSMRHVELDAGDRDQRVSNVVVLYELLGGSRF